MPRPKGSKVALAGANPVRRLRRRFALHAEDAVDGLVPVVVQRAGQGHRENLPGFPWIDHAIIPKPGAGIIRGAFLLIFFQNRFTDRGHSSAFRTLPCFASCATFTVASTSAACSPPMT